jgi:homocysteine S-methyltransferase
METALVFHRGIELPCFASFPLLASGHGIQELRSYFEHYARIARDRSVGLIPDTPTWRANLDWGEKLGFAADDLAALNRKAVRLIEQIRSEHESYGTPIMIGGCLGPRDDAYRRSELMSATEAERYHSAQVATLSDTNADLVTALTLAYPEEAIGIVRAARGNGMPVVISFTVETDGRLPNGVPLRDAIERVDAETDGEAAYFMITCAHPTHFQHTLEGGEDWPARIGRLRASASRKSHAELDAAESSTRATRPS